MNYKIDIPIFILIIIIIFTLNIERFFPNQDINESPKQTLTRLYNELNICLCDKINNGDDPEREYINCHSNEFKDFKINSEYRNGNYNDETTSKYGQNFLNNLECNSERIILNCTIRYLCESTGLTIYEVIGRSLPQTCNEHSSLIEALIALENEYESSQNLTQQQGTPTPTTLNS
jgi:hypothetical protein